MRAANDVCRGVHPTTGERIDGVEATALRRHTGNTLVNPPCRHLGRGVFEQAVLDGHGGYYYPLPGVTTGRRTFVIQGW